MPSLKKDLIQDIMQEVEIVYLNKDISRWWNGRRSGDDPPVFCGFFWIRGRQEGGPFRTRSAALRDAFYRFVAHRNLPKIWSDDIPKSVLHPKKLTTAKKVRKRSAEQRASV